jgi:hypothetical protein
MVSVQEDCGPKPLQHVVTHGEIAHQSVVMFRILVADTFAEASQIKEITEADAVIWLEVFDVLLKGYYGLF